MIKLFEEYNNSEYYWKISRNEYPEPDKIISISSDAIKFVKKIYDKSKFLTAKVEHTYGRKYISIWTYDRCIMTIIELPDEWFYISKAGHKYYKCDQLEGLKKFILSDYYGRIALSE